MKCTTLFEYVVVVSVGNDLLLLKPGMTATTRIITDARAGVLRVPNQSLRYVPRGMPAGLSGPAAGKTASGASTLPNHVWVLRNGKPEQAAVAVGIDDDNWTEITGGQLNAGDLVIVSEQDATASAKKSTPPPKL